MRAKRAISILWVLAMMTSTVGCERPSGQLAKLTDIEIKHRDVDILVTELASLDQPRFKIVVPKDEEPAFQRALDSAAGKSCLQLVSSGSSCHYKAQSGHDIFIEHVDAEYRIYTSGHF